MRILKDRRGISPVITTVIIVAVGITIAIAVALWMTGLAGAFMGYEKIEIRSAFPNPSSGGGWDIVINYLNTGSTPAKIDNVFINNIPYDEWTTISCVPDIAGGTYAEANIGVEGTITLTLTDPCTYGDQNLVSGVTVTIKLHSTGGKEYFTSVVLP